MNSVAAAELQHTHVVMLAQIWFVVWFGSPATRRDAESGLILYHEDRHHCPASSFYPRVHQSYNSKVSCTAMQVFDHQNASGQNKPTKQEHLVTLNRWGLPHILKEVFCYSPILSHWPAHRTLEKLN